MKEAEAAKEEAKEQGDKDALAKMNKRTVRVTPQHNAEAKRLLQLMGVPVVQAPCEAEAQCSALVQAGKVYGVATEDMDSLTLGAPLLLRHMTYSEARKMPIREIRLDKALEGLGLSMESFIDLCILLGCDYCDTIKGIGPKRALEQIRKYKSIDGVIKHLDKEKHPLPESFPFAEIREYFKKPEVTDPESIELKWTDPDEEGLIQFLAREKAFSEDRVRKGIEKLKKNRQTSVQGRLTSFFTAKPAAPIKGGKADKGKAAEEADDDMMDIDFGGHKSDEEPDEEEELSADDAANKQTKKPAEPKKEPAAAASSSSPVKPTKPDPVVADAKPVKSWGDIFGKKLGGNASSSSKSSSSTASSSSPVKIKKDPNGSGMLVDEEAGVPVKQEPVADSMPASPAPTQKPSEKKRTPSGKRGRVIEDDADDDEDDPAKKSKFD